MDGFCQRLTAEVQENIFPTGSLSLYLVSPPLMCSYSMVLESLIQKAGHLFPALQKGINIKLEATFC